MNSQSQDMLNARRALTTYEVAVLDVMLMLPFPGRNELREQIDHSSVETIAEFHDNYGSIRFHVSSPTKAKVVRRVPVEARAIDDDDVPIDFLLHVVDGILHMLEITKLDGSQLHRNPEPATLDVLIH